MNIAVTGATGFIGRYVISELERQGAALTLVTRPGAVIPDALRKHRAVPCDLTQPAASQFDEIGRPDVLVHLAWGGLPNFKSARHFEDELPAQYRFLKSLMASGLSRCVITGTCLEYGLQSGELSEEQAALPTTPYGFAKDCLRRQLEFLRARTPFALTWARLFYMYGDGQPATSLYPQLKDAAARGAASFDMSGGEQLRDYLPVEEVARLLVALTLSPVDGGVVNICSGSGIQVRRLVEQWVAQNGWRLDLRFGRLPYPDYEPMAFWGSRNKLNRLVASAANAARHDV